APPSVWFATMRWRSMVLSSIDASSLPRAGHVSPGGAAPGHTAVGEWAAAAATIPDDRSGSSAAEGDDADGWRG
ncbi:MAG: hypothetical protein R3320_09290, partial [Nitriliruptorales bacterium]|nr:hypothetical protein [Nitriliruptorales bacterium]